VLFKHFGFTEENVADTVLVAIGAARLKPAKKAR
jgi:transketolase